MTCEEFVVDMASTYQKRCEELEHKLSEASMVLHSYEMVFNYMKSFFSIEHYGGENEYIISTKEGADIWKSSDPMTFELVQKVLGLEMPKEEEVQEDA